MSTLTVTMVAGITGELTTEYSTSSYGQPVLVVDGTAYGPGDAIPEPYLSRTSMRRGEVWGILEMTWPTAREDYRRSGIAAPGAVDPIPPILRAWRAASDRHIPAM